jgi:hypothetical protein
LVVEVVPSFHRSAVASAFRRTFAGQLKLAATALRKAF